MFFEQSANPYVGLYVWVVAMVSGSRSRREGGNPPMKTMLALPDDLVAHYTGRMPLR